MTKIEYETDSRDESRIDVINGVKIDGEEVDALDYDSKKSLAKVTDADASETEAWDDLQDAVDAGEVEAKVVRGTLKVEEVDETEQDDEADGEDTEDGDEYDEPTVVDATVDAFREDEDQTDSVEANLWTKSGRRLYLNGLKNDPYVDLEEMSVEDTSYEEAEVSVNDDGALYVYIKNSGTYEVTVAGVEV